METKLSYYTSNSLLMTKRALGKMVLGFRAMRNMKIQRTQENTHPLHATLGMILEIVRPLEAEYQLALSMAIQLQYQQLERSSGMQSELLGQKSILQSFNGNWLTTNLQLIQVWKVSMPQIQLMEQNHPKHAQLGSQCGQ